MSRKSIWLHRLPHLLLILILLTLLAGSLGFKRDGPTIASVAYVEQVQASVNGGSWETYTLPHSFADLAPRTPVVVRATIVPKNDDAVYIKTVYSPARIYLDDQWVFTFGKEENYPAFMLDPATEIHMVETYGAGEPMELRMEFQSPRTRNSLMVHPPMVGTSKELIMERSRTLGIPLVFSMVQIVSGILMILISACIVLVDQKGSMFFWLGLFSLSTGCWSFGENNFSGIIFRDSALLYLLSFIGLFTFLLPLLQFIRTLVDFADPRPIIRMEFLFSVTAALALLLQLLGVMACSQSMYVFHVALPIALVAVTLLIVRESLEHQNISARRLILPVSVLALTAMLELLSYQAAFTYVFSSIFQLGILFFLVVMGVTAGLFLRDSVDLRNRQRELAFEKSLVDIQIQDQTERSLLLAHKEQLLRQQRHDLRHQLTAIRELAGPDNHSLQTYLQTLMDQIPPAEQIFCENRTVNAILSYYAPICREKQIDLTLRLVVPPCQDPARDSDLCVIFGNLLENAVEACDRMTEGARFIRLNSSLQTSLLTITMDNSFNGQVQTENGRFRSSKRNDYGVGLASVRSVASRCGGEAEFLSNGTIFLSSVYLHL